MRIPESRTSSDFFNRIKDAITGGTQTAITVTYTQISKLFNFTINVDNNTIEIDGTNNWLQTKTKINRVTANTTLDNTYYEVFVDTDSAAITITLPAGTSGKSFRIINTGTSNNAVTITPDGSELLLGENSSFTLLGGDVIIITYETTEGWY